ncbi:type I polyketide synthase [Nocardia mangyaensis]|uniref:type I polyketide synthase n=1 Tax=Nocardia mangyaensis TaxID=2213200 RepID=UPI0026760A00|nr:type I polyketide synthase [Nocardia mangyaensis]MDO3647385.1 acyltransferase domain-containing protein [Nocardia mangyaensis]
MSEATVSNDERLREYLRRATTELQQTRRRLRLLEAQHNEPIAIVGMACRYPGGVTTPEELWRVLAAGDNVAAEYPRDRGWDEFIELVTRGNRPPGLTLPGGYLYDATTFDAEFFGISPREAATISPQQRQLLEVAWESVERAGIDPAALRGREVGVFAGINNEDYGTMIMLSGSDIVHFSTSCAPSVLSGRVSYFLGLEGPSVTVDTACSASLVTLHMAVHSLRTGECELALAGGSTVMATPTTILGFAANQGLSSDGRCKSFSEEADGVGWGEGAGMLVLERLSDARRNGHDVLAVVRGSAVNSDGASNGLTAPNGPSQQRVIRQALINAKLSAADVDVVEAHGTGTALGDPIEAQALLATYGQDRDRPLWLGSIKSNMGHTQAAAGVGGIIKMVLAMRHELLPRSLHASTPSSKIDWSAGAVELLAESRPWPVGERVRRAAVSSFGISGTNAHVILEEAPPEPAADAPKRPPADARSAQTRVGAPSVPTDPGGPAERSASVASSIVPWVLSARTPAALAQLAQRLLDWPTTASATDTGWSLLHTRSLFDSRAVVLGADRDELLAGVRAVAAGTYRDGVVTGAVEPGRGETVFVFPGQGSQWPAMARELLATAPVFAASLADCDNALAPYVDWSVHAVLTEADGAPSLDRVDVVQPVLFAVMVSLAALWDSLGVTPDIVVGHSQGEIAAACVAGALSLSDAAKVVARRSQALVELAGLGAMVSVTLPRGQVEQRLRQWDGRLSIAAVNGPRDIIVSGAVDAAEELRETLSAEGISSRRIAVDYAAHSTQVERVRDTLLSALRDITAQPGAIPLWSSVTGDWLDTTTMTADYWYRNLRETVELEHAIRQLATRAGVFVEVGPHPVLAIGIESTLEDLGVTVPVVSTLRRDNGGPAQLAAAAARIFVRGVPVDWDHFFTDAEPQRADLPLYPFQRQPFWLLPKVTLDGSQLDESAPPSHPMLDAAVPIPGSTSVTVAGSLSLTAQPWLNGHEMLGHTMMPGTGLVELALEAGARVSCPHLAELVIEAPLVIAGDGTSVRVDLEPAGEGRTFVIYSRPAVAPLDQPWTRQAAGLLTSIVPSLDSHRFAALASWPPADATPIDISDLHQRLTVEGYGFPPAFRGLRAAWQHGGEMFAEVALPAPEQREADRFRIHPALLDAAMHVMIAGASSMVEDGMIVGFLWAGVTLRRTGADAIRVRITSGEAGPSGNAVSLAIADEHGRPVGLIESVIGRPISRRQLAAVFRSRDSHLHAVTWQPTSPRQSAEPIRWAAVGFDAAPMPVGCSGPDMAAVAARLSAVGERPDVVLLDGGTATLAVEVENWSRLDCFTGSRLAVILPAAVDSAALTHRAQAAVARVDHSGRCVLAHVADDWSALSHLATTDEPELRFDGPTVSVRRLTRVDHTTGPLVHDLDLTGTALVAGAVDRRVLEYLARERGVSRILHLTGGEPVTGCGVPVDTITGVDELRVRNHAVTSVCYFADDRSATAQFDTLWELHQKTTDLADFTIFASAEALLDTSAHRLATAICAYAESLIALRHSDGKPARLILFGAVEDDELPGALDLAHGMGLPTVVAGLDPALAGQRANPLFRALARAGVELADEEADYGRWATALSGLTGVERSEQLLSLVHHEIAEALGHDTIDAFSADRLFDDLGVESIAAMQIRERISLGAGVRMPVTLIFDHKTTRAVARYAESRMFQSTTEEELG